MRHRSRPRQVFLTDPKKAHIAGLLCLGKWSPELIIEPLALKAETCVGHTTIYRWVWEVKKKLETGRAAYFGRYKNLRHWNRKRKPRNIKDKRGVITGGAGIDQRPSVVEQRQDFKDIEVDLRIGNKLISALLEMRDRAAR